MHRDRSGDAFILWLSLLPHLLLKFQRLPRNIAAICEFFASPQDEEKRTLKALSRFTSVAHANVLCLKVSGAVRLPVR